MLEPRRVHPALLVALGALAVLLALGAGALGVGLHDRLTATPAAPVARTRTPPRDPPATPAPWIDPPPPARVETRTPEPPPPPPVDPAGIRYRVIEVGGIGPRSEIHALLERARPGVARCAIPGRALHVAVYFIGTIAGHITLAGASYQRPSDDGAVASCVGTAIAAAGPMRFSGMETATVELDVDLPAQ